MTNNEKRYARVAVLFNGMHHVAALDRVTGDAVLAASSATVNELNRGQISSGRYAWLTPDRFEVIGELGPAPERLAPPFEDVEVADEDGDWLRVQSEDRESGSCAYVGIGRAWQRYAECSAYITPEQAPVVASAILRAAGVDPESVDWAEAAKGGE